MDSVWCSIESRADKCVIDGGKQSDNHQIQNLHFHCQLEIQPVSNARQAIVERENQFAFRTKNESLAIPRVRPVAD